MKNKDIQELYKKPIFDPESPDKINEAIDEEDILSVIKEIEDRKKLLSPSSFRNT